MGGLSSLRKIDYGSEPITLNLQSRFLDIRLRGYIVPLEHRRGFVARQFHCDRFRNSTPHHITHRRTAQVVKDEAAGASDTGGKYGSASSWKTHDIGCRSPTYCRCAESTLG
jgi:hypothetical protein